MKYTLGTFIFGVPEFETLYHLLKRLRERGNLELKIILPSRLCRIEPRVPMLLNEAQLPFFVQHSKVIKYFCRRYFRGMNYVVGISDPFMDFRRSHKRRNRYMVKQNVPSIYFQHGVIQADLHRSSSTATPGFSKEKIDFYSKKAFLMELPTQTQQEFFTESALARIEISGFIKKACFPPKPLPLNIGSQLSKFDRRLLICHSLRSSDFVQEDIIHFYSMIEEFAIDNPKIGVIVRSHRGKRRKRYEAYDRKLESKCPNVYFMYHHHGPLKRMSITDAVSIVDMVISSPSTAVLDSVYMGKPTAICLKHKSVFESLPQITDAKCIKRFVAHANGARESGNKIMDRFGILDDNIEKTCQKVEEIVTALDAKGH